MNQTPNYNLNQWEATDRVQRTDFNADNAKIDAAIKAESDARTALVGQVTKRGNCQLYITSYVGSGGYGKENTRSITFPHEPQVVILSTSWGNIISVIIRGMTAGVPHGFSTIEPTHVTWEGNTFSWYGSSEKSAFNAENTTYFVAALLAADK